MSAVLTRRRPSRARDRDASRGRQERLFAGLGSAPPEAAPAEPRAYREPRAPDRGPGVEPPAEPRGHAQSTAPAPAIEPADESRGHREPAVVRDEGVAPAGAAPTLEDAITGLWDALRRRDAAACPVCGADIQPRHSAAAGVVGGRCGACDSTLS